MSEDDVNKRSGGVLRKSGHHHKGSSGEHPIMQAVRKKLDSIREGTLPELEALNARIDRLRVKSDPPVQSIPPTDEKDEGEEDTIPGIEVPTPEAPER